MKLKQFAILIIVFLLLTLSTGVVLAAQPPDKTVVESGETINNDIVLLGEDLEVQEGATVNGDVVLFGGDATISGAVTGDVVLFGGDLTVEDTAVFEGDCALLGGNLHDNRAESGGNCHSVNIGPDFIPALPQLPAILNNMAGAEFEVHRPSAGRQFFGGLAGTIGQTLMMALLAFGMASLMPNHLTQIEGTVRHQPMKSGVMGLLTAVSIFLIILALLASIFVCIGVLFFPVTFLLAVGLAAGMVMGWITMGDLVGRWLAERLNLKNRNLATTAVFGTAVLTFGVGMMSTLNLTIAEIFITIILGSIGLGAATLTRFGTRPYPLGASYGTVMASSESENSDKVTAVLETLPIEDTADLKDN